MLLLSSWILYQIWICTSVLFWSLIYVLLQLHCAFVYVTFELLDTLSDMDMQWFAILELDLCVASVGLEKNLARLLAMAIAISTSDH